MNRGYFNLLLPQLNRQLLGSIQSLPANTLTASARIIQKAFHASGEPHHCKGRRVERGTRFADTIATLGSFVGFFCEFIGLKHALTAYSCEVCHLFSLKFATHSR